MLDHMPSLDDVVKELILFTMAVAGMMVLSLVIRDAVHKHLLKREKVRKDLRGFEVKLIAGTTSAEQKKENDHG